MKPRMKLGPEERRAIQRARWHAEQERQIWRQKPKEKLLRQRQAQRDQRQHEDGEFVRCSCGALLFKRQVQQHLAEMHGVSAVEVRR